MTEIHSNITLYSRKYRLICSQSKSVADLKKTVSKAKEGKKKSTIERIGMNSKKYK